MKPPVLLLLLLGSCCNFPCHIDAFLPPPAKKVSISSSSSSSSSTATVSSRRPGPSIHTIHASSTSSTSSTTTPSSPPTPPPPPPSILFDSLKAIKLAAFSFSIYGDPTGSRWLRMPDGTDLGFQSDDLVRKNFRALLLVHILTARNLPQEKGGFLEKALSGGACDPYIITSVNNSFGADLAITRAKSANSNPDFYQRFFLYVEDPATAVLELTVKDQNMLKGDDVIGYCRVPLSEYLEGNNSESEHENDAEEEDGGVPFGVKEWAGTLEIEPPGAAAKAKGKIKKGSGGGAGTVEVELQLVPLGDDEEEEDAKEEETDDKHQGIGSDPDAGDDNHRNNKGPRSVLEGIDWNDLGSKVGGVAKGLARYQLACFLTNEDTDTQAALWMDRKAKEIIFSFRGTQMEWKDLLTDMLILQEGLDGAEDERKVHAGFRRAFASIRDAAFQALAFIVPDEKLVKEGWTIDVCGHSLGGALACLMTYELDRRFPSLVKENRLQMVSFGAPRVGNKAFCDDYDARLKEASFRIVNGLDVVARMPRGTRQPTLLEYSHCGRTVLLTEGEEGKISVWVEGESPGVCPLREMDPFAAVMPAAAGGGVGGGVVAAALPSGVSDKEKSPFSSSSLFELQLPISLATFSNGTQASLQEMLRAAGNLTNLQAMLSSSSSLSFTPGMFNQLNINTDMTQLADAFVGSAFNSTAMVGKSLGLDSDFVDSEIEMMRSLIYGDALMQHMEPLYYVALEKAFVNLGGGGGGRIGGVEGGGEGEGGKGEREA